ncbi:glycoside hydrolase family 9 protein, partial [Candidatus Omnitrophota bacterium]
PISTFIVGLEFLTIPTSLGALILLLTADAMVTNINKLLGFKNAPEKDLTRVTVTRPLIDKRKIFDPVVRVFGGAKGSVFTKESLLLVGATALMAFAVYLRGFIGASGPYMQPTSALTLYTLTQIETYMAIGLGGALLYLVTFIGRKILDILTKTTMRRVVLKFSYTLLVGLLLFPTLTRAIGGYISPTDNVPVMSVLAPDGEIAPVPSAGDAVVDTGVGESNVVIAVVDTGVGESNVVIEEAPLPTTVPTPVYVAPPVITPPATTEIYSGQISVIQSYSLLSEAEQIEQWNLHAPLIKVTQGSHGAIVSFPSDRDVPVDVGDIFYLQNKSGRVVFAGELSGGIHTTDSQETVFFADYSGFMGEGNYTLHLAVGENRISSSQFLLSPDAYASIAQVIMRSWEYRKTEHYNVSRTVVLGSDTDHPGASITLPHSLFIEGNYGIYMTTFTEAYVSILTGMRHNPELVNIISQLYVDDDMATNDGMELLRYGLEWMLAMQITDPESELYGGVYEWEGGQTSWSPLSQSAADMPQRYVYGGYSTVTAAQFSTAMAQAAIVFRDYDPVLAQRYYEAAVRSWQFLDGQSTRNFEAPSGVSTGSYGDDQRDVDERVLAAVSLLQAQALFPDSGISDEELRAYVTGHSAELQIAHYSHPWYRNMDVLAAGEILLGSHGEISPEFSKTQAEIRTQILEYASKRLYQIADNGYRFGSDGYFWGFNRNLMDDAHLFLYAYMLTYDSRYLDAAENHLAYLMGRNPWGRSFITGPNGPSNWGVSDILSMNNPILEMESGEPHPGLVIMGPCASLPYNVQRDSFWDYWTDDGGDWRSTEPTVDAQSSTLVVAGSIEYFRSQRADTRSQVVDILPSLVTEEGDLIIVSNATHLDNLTTLFLGGTVELSWRTFQGEAGEHQALVDYIDYATNLSEHSVDINTLDDVALTNLLYERLVFLPFPWVQTDPSRISRIVRNIIAYRHEHGYIDSLDDVRLIGRRTAEEMEKLGVVVTSEAPAHFSLRSKSNSLTKQSTPTTERFSVAGKEYDVN